MINVKEDGGAIIFTVRVAARAAKSEVVGFHDGALKIRIAAAPVDGAANAELVKLLARTFDVSKSAVEILSGQTAKTKQIKISGASRAALARIANV
jgi:uncharacterized protein